MSLPPVRRQTHTRHRPHLYFALGIIAPVFAVIIVSNRTHAAPVCRNSEIAKISMGTLSPWDLYGTSIALIIHSVDHSLIARLIYPFS